MKHDSTAALADIDAALALFDPPPPWPDYTEPWVAEGRKFRDALLALKNGTGYPSCCLRFTGRHTSYGIGYLLCRRLRKRGNYWKFSPTHFPAHYVAWQVDTGSPVPQGFVPQQTCKKKDCINPLHLILRPSKRPSKKVNPMVNYYDFS